MGTEASVLRATPACNGQRNRPGKQDVRIVELRGSSSGIWRLVDQQGGRLEGVVADKPCSGAGRENEKRRW